MKIKGSQFTQICIIKIIIPLREIDMINEK
jgi:hypothetical protein